MINVDVVIVNWNGGNLLRRTVEALTRSEQSTFRFGLVAIVDNASTDGSVQWLCDLGAAKHPATIEGVPVRLVQNPTNRGFAAACNQGAAEGTGGYVIFLNPDTEVGPDTIDHCVSLSTKRNDIGALGVQLVDATGTPQLSCARFPSPTRFLWKALGVDRLMPTVFRPHYLTNFDHNSSRTVDQVMGAFLLTPRWVFEKFRGFDERFFVYFEEVDYCYRLVIHDLKVYFLASTCVYHKGGGTTEQAKDQRLFYSLRSRLLFGYKHFGIMGAHLQTVSTLSIELIVRLLRAMINGSPRAVWRGYRALFLELPAIVRSNSDGSVNRNESLFVANRQDA